MRRVTSDEKTVDNFRALLRYPESCRVVLVFCRLPPTEHLLTVDSWAHKGMMDSMSGLRRESKESWNGKTRSQANAVSFIFMGIVSGIKESRRGHRSLQKTHWCLPA